MIHHGYPSKWMYLSWIHNEFSIQISARCCVLMHMLVDVIGFSTNLGISSIKTGSLCYPFKRTSGYIPINMENKMNLLNTYCSILLLCSTKKVDSAIAAKMVGNFSGEMRRYPKKQQIDTRHTQLRN